MDFTGSKPVGAITRPQASDILYVGIPGVITWWQKDPDQVGSLYNFIAVTYDNANFTLIAAGPYAQGINSIPFTHTRTGNNCRIVENITDSYGNVLTIFSATFRVVNATQLAIIATPPIATLGVPYSFTPSVVGGTAPYTWSTSGKPSWLFFNSSNGNLFGTPGAGAKTITFSLRVQDKTGKSASTNLTINIPASLPVINADTPTTANIGVHYASTPSVSGGTSPFIWSSNGKPSWLALNNTTGALSGTPDSCAKTTTFTLKVQDKNWNNASKDLTIIIPLSTPMINLGTVNPATIGKYYIITPNVLGGTEPYVWSAQGKPYWLALDTNGYLSGTPDNNAKTVTFTLQVQDKCGSRDSKSVTVNVSQDPNTLTDDELIARAKQRAQGQPAIGNLSCLEYCQRYGIGLCAVANGSTGSCKLGAYNILYQNNDAATGTRKSGVFLLQGIDDLTTVLHGNYERPGSGDFIVWMPNAAGADSQCGHIAYVELVEAHRVVIRQANVYTVDQSGNRNYIEWKVLHNSDFRDGMYGYPRNTPCN
ncbi:MAG: Ig domain-containing protein [Syntrophales bacterium]|nr:Ig domain-containing protein [Syntrophales bacterium]